MCQADDVLSEAGIRFLTRWRPGSRENEGMRVVSRLISKAVQRGGLSYLWNIKAAQREFISLVSQSPTRIVIVSDENLLGDPFAFSTGSSIYPDSTRYLAATARMLPVRPERVHITIRDYATFLVSVYAMQALYRSEVPLFGTIKDALMKVDHSWLTVMRSAKASFPSAQITFSRFEDDPIQTAMAAVLLPDVSTSQFSPVRPVTNRAPSAEAIEAALKSKQRSIADADKLVRQFADGKPFDPLDVEERLRLSASYQDHVSQLRAEFREVGGQTVPQI